MTWPWTLGLGLFKVIENGTVQQTMYDYLLVRHCNSSSVLYHFRDRIWIVSFARYSELLVQNREIFIPHLHLASPQGWPHQNLVKLFDADKTRMIGLPCGEKLWQYVTSRFHLIPERHGRTDRQAGRFVISISRVSVLMTRDKTLAHLHTFNRKWPRFVVQKRFITYRWHQARIYRGTELAPPPPKLSKH